MIGSSISKKTKVMGLSFEEGEGRKVRKEYSFIYLFNI